MERARRLRRTIFVRPCGVLRHGSICHRDPAGALRGQCLDRIPDRHCGWRAGRHHHRCARLPLRSARLLFRAGDARLCGGAAHPGERGADHRRRGRYVDPAQPAARGLSVPEPRAILLDRTRIGRDLASDRAPDRAEPVRRLPGRRARERGRRQGARHQSADSQARRHGDLSRDYGGGRMLLCAVFPLC